MSHGKRDESQLERVVREHMPPPEQRLPLPVLPNRVDRLMRLFEAMGAWISEFDNRGHLIYANPTVETITGFTPAECLAGPVLEFHPDDMGAVIALGREVRATGKPHSNETRVRHKSGRWVWIRTTLMGWYDVDGGDYHTIAASRDISARKRAERERVEMAESMQRAQKLESLGVLAGGIAHDFNNLLTPILGSAGLALRDLPEDSAVRSHIEKIVQAANRAAALTSQMLAYAGQNPLRVEPIDLSRLVSEMQDLVSSSISGKTILDLHLEGDLPAVEGEAAQLSQVVMNLVTNAAEALPDGVGRIAVRTGVVQVDTPPPGLLFADTMNPGPHVYFEVNDAGSGMDAELRRRIFDPFFTTKFTGRGLGLAAVAGIVRAHRGAIEVDSALGRGTRFRVLLPTTSEVASPAVRRSPRIEEWRATGVALVIDDDEGVRDLAEHLLRRTGMTVLTAADGHEGVKLFRLHAEDIRVVLLDRTMPALSGSDTFEAIRALRPDANIVVVSGYSEHHVTAELGGRGIDGFLKKPFAPETLLARVREVLERNGQAGGADPSHG